DLLSKVRELSPNTMRILLTGYSDLAAIVGSVNDGEVFRFISKPWDQEDIKKTLADATEIALKTWRNSKGVVSYTQEVVAPSASKTTQEMLILDDSEMDRHWISKLFETNYRVHGASNINDALHILEKNPVGVIVAEASVGGEDTGTLLKVLKQQYPVITTVMLTNNADADHVIKLINQAQIYRFATKPVKRASLELAVNSAMKHHERLASDPQLRARHAVVRSADVENSSIARTLMRGLAGLTARWGLFRHS
ncbi:MAG: response regulator, partial [Casimicrobium sp.]